MRERKQSEEAVKKKETKNRQKISKERLNERQISTTLKDEGM
jgi:hypothetical protein